MRRAGVVLCMVTALAAAPRVPWGQLVLKAEEAVELPRASLVLKVRVGAIAEDEVGSMKGTKCETTCEVISTLKEETGKEVRIRFRRQGNGPVRPGLDALKAGEVHIVMLRGETAPYEAYAAMRAVDAVVEPTYGKRPGDRLLAELVAMCRSGDAAMRIAAIDQIGFLKDTRAKEEADAAARSDDAELARAGLTAQYRMGIAPDAKRVMELFDDLMLGAWYQESGVPRRDAVGNVLRRQQGEQRILERGVPDFDYATFLREGIKKEWIREDDHKLYSFFGVPWKVQRRECVPELIKLLGDPKRRVRWHAASCLTNTVLNKQGPDYEHFAKQEEAELETWQLWWKEEGLAFMGEAAK